MSKSKFFIFIILCNILCFISCSSDKKSDAQHGKYKDTIYVAVTPTFDCLPIIIAKEAGVSDSRDHNIIIKYFNSKSDCDTALAGGSVSAIFTDYMHAARLKENWKEMVRQRRGKKAKPDSLSIFQHDNLQLCLLTNFKARINEAKQLTDKMIALERKSPEALVAQHVLDSVHLSGDKTFLINVQSYPVRKNMLFNNIMDAVVLPEPYAAEARKAGHKSIYSTSRMDDKPFGNMVATRHVAVIKHMYNLGCHALNSTDIHNYDSILIKNLGVSKGDITAIIKQKFTPIK